MNERETAHRLVGARCAANSTGGTNHCKACDGVTAALAAAVEEMRARCEGAVQRLRSRAGHPLTDAAFELAVISIAALAPRGVATPDACENCHGTRGGEPGNENVVTVNGVRRVLCDDCHAEASRGAATSEADAPPKLSKEWLLKRAEQHRIDGWPERADEDLCIAAYAPSAAVPKQEAK